MRNHPRLKAALIASPAALAFAPSGAPSGIVGRVRADARSTQLIAEINTAFTEFRTRSDGERATLVASVERLQERVAAFTLLGGSGARDRGTEPLSAEIVDSLRAQFRGMPAASMSTQSNPDGGYTVVPQLDDTIEATLRDLTPLRRLARIVKMKPGHSEWQKVIPVNGAESGWAGEEDERADTDGPQFGLVTIVPREIFALPQLTNHLIEDSAFDVASFMEEDVAGEFSLREGEAFVDGNGIKRPQGFLARPTSADSDATRAFGTLQYITTGAAGAFPASDPADKLKDLVATLKPAYRKGAGVAFLMNSSTANTISKFKDANGNFIWKDSLIEGQPDRLLGYAVELDEGMPDIANNAYAVAFGNWRRGYAIVDKPGTKLIVDKVTRKGWTKLYFYKRVGGGTLDSRAIKLLRFSA
jgi:HK97 family phage major capsid protein